MNYSSIPLGLALAVLTLIAGSEVTGYAANFYGLGPESSTARGVSADGSVVVGSGPLLGGDQEAFRWTAATGLVRLGLLPGASHYSSASDVSDDGSVVVGSSRSASSDFEAFRWTPAEGMVGMGFLPGGSPDSQGSAVSGDGSTIVGVSSSARSSPYEAFRWTATSGMVGLGDLPGGDFYSAASGVSRDGSVVAGRGSTATFSHAVRWTSSTGMVDLGDLPPGGIDSSVAAAVSADGSTIVGFGSSAASAANPARPGVEAFRWTAAGGTVALGDLPGGDFSSLAQDVSADGSRVVGMSDTGSAARNGHEAFLWDEAHGMRRLHDVLVTDYGLADRLNGWSLWHAWAISDDGMTIVGEGFNQGVREAWVVNLHPIPEPPALILLAAGLPILLLARRSIAAS